MWSVLRGHVHTSRALLDARASLQHHDSLGATPLMLAVQHKSYKSLIILMHRGKDNKDSMLRDSDNNGCTPAHWAAYKGDLTSLRLLDYFNADLLAVDNAGMLPLHRAVSASEGAVIEFLMEKRSDPTQHNKDGKSCVDIAEEQHCVHIHGLLKRLMAKSGKGGEGGAQQDVEKGSAGEPAKKQDDLFKSITKDKAAQKAFPVFWVVCVALSVFEYLMELRATSYAVAPNASLLFELGVPLSLALFFYVALTDPGRLPPRLKGHSGVEEVMRALDGGTAEGQEEPDVGRLCTTTWVLKDLRTKYCAQTGACIEEFDHYCVWLNTSIGKKNHRQFFALCLVEWTTQLIHIYVCWSMAHSLVPYSGFFSWIFAVFTMYPLLAFLLIVQCLTVPWILMLVVHQSRLVVTNLTTNEMMNMHRYEHFWVSAMVEPGRVQRMFRNPFHKGNMFTNCLDFWWYRQRSLIANKGGATCNAPGCRHQHHN